MSARACHFLYQDYRMLFFLIELRLALISCQDYHMLVTLIELRLALTSYQDYHMLPCSSCDWPSFRTRITTCCCPLP